MQCNFMFLKLNMPNEIFLFFQNVKRNESTREKTLHNLTPPGNDAKMWWASVLQQEFSNSQGYQL